MRVFSYLYTRLKLPLYEALSYLCTQEVQMLELSREDYLGVMRYALYLLYWY
jgi:hypothetical protein